MFEVFVALASTFFVFYVGFKLASLNFELEDAEQDALDLVSPVNLKVGVAVPCRVEDKPLLGYCLNSVKHLRPIPFHVAVDINNGGSLREIRGKLFDFLFESGCDVVLSVDVDFWLFPQILSRVRAERVVSFAQLERNFGDFPQALARLFWGRSWSGCYSIPKHIWFQIRSRWDGTDTNIKELVGDYRFERRFSYFALCPRNTFSLVKVLKKRLGVKK